MSFPAEALGLSEFSLAATAVVSLITALVLVVTVFFLLGPREVDFNDELRRTHRRLGIAGKDDSAGPSRQRPAEPDSAQAGRTARIQSLWVYPVKSCRGIELDHSTVATKGLEFDRLYTFAVRMPRHPELEVREVWELPDRDDRFRGGKDELPEWEIATIRRQPLLANVKVDLWLPDETTTTSCTPSTTTTTSIIGTTKHGKNPQAQTRSNSSRSDSSSSSGGGDGGFIVITFPRVAADASLARGLVQAAAAKLRRGWSAVPQKQIMLPLQFPSPGEVVSKGYRYEQLQFFRRRVEALNMGSEVPPELSAYLGTRGSVSLFRMDPARRRRVYGNAPRKEAVGFQPVVDFQDLYPVHLLSLSSLRALESKVQKDEQLRKLDFRRFRPNIVVSGLPEYDEDDWRAIQAKSVTSGCQDILNFDVSCRTVRCKLPNVDPDTGIRHKIEPDRTLRKHRDIDVAVPGNGCFGMQMCPLLGDAETAVLRVGMEIDVLKRGPHAYIKNTATP